jgi:beta-phosphoglucomutase-like phosphatase (HAD superfamily)
MKAIIFDVDGVIIKSEGNKKKVIKEIFEKH